MILYTSLRNRIVTSDTGVSDLIFLRVSDGNTDQIPVGYNCGPSSEARIAWFVQDLRRSISKNYTIECATITEHDTIITVTCPQGDLNIARSLVEGAVRRWMRSGKLTG